MRKIGSDSFFDRHVFREGERKNSEKIENAFSEEALPKQLDEIEQDLEKYNPEKRYRQVLIFWRAREFEKKERHPRWHWIFFGILFALVLYAFLTSNLIMSIIFILFGFLFYFYEKNEPKEYTFGVNNEGVFAQDRIYSFDSLENFWIFYEPGGIKELSLKSQKTFMPYISLPLGATDPNKIRDILLKRLPEKEHEKGLMSILERIL